MNIGRPRRAFGRLGEDDPPLRVLGLLTKPQAHRRGYRIYDENDIHTLRFVRRRATWDSRSRKSRTCSGSGATAVAPAATSTIAQRHIAELEAKIAELQGMRRTLHQLVQHCHGDHRPDCPILDDLAGEAPMPSIPSAA